MPPPGLRIDGIDAPQSCGGPGIVYQQRGGTEIFRCALDHAFYSRPVCHVGRRADGLPAITLDLGDNRCDLALGSRRNTDFATRRCYCVSDSPADTPSTSSDDRDLTVELAVGTA